MASKSKRDIHRLILESAHRRFLSEGLRKTTMESIAADLKISKKTLYAEFTSKKEIWQELVQAEALLVIGNWRGYFVNDISPLDKLCKLSGYYLRRKEHGSNEASSALSYSTLGKLPVEDVRGKLREEAMRTAFPMMVEELITAHQLGGKSQEADHTTLSAMIVAMVEAVRELGTTETNVPALLRKMLD